MAGDWIKMRTELGADPDVIEMAAMLNLDEFGVVGRLHAVWSWLDSHSESGTNVRIVSAYLDRLTACPGFSDALRAVKWLSGKDGNLTFPGYENHNGSTAKRRASESKRKQRTRTNVRKQCGQMSRSTADQRREEKRIEEDRELKLSCPNESDEKASWEDVWENSPTVSRQRSSKKQAAAAWKALKASERPSRKTILGALDAWNASEKWQGGFAEGIHRWIANRQWENLPEPSKPTHRVSKQRREFDEESKPLPILNQ